jgi:hypothetical protein
MTYLIHVADAHEQITGKAVSLSASTPVATIATNGMAACLTGNGSLQAGRVRLEDCEAAAAPHRLLELEFVNGTPALWRWVAITGFFQLLFHNDAFCGQFFTLPAKILNFCLQQPFCLRLRGNDCRSPVVCALLRVLLWR